MADSTSAANPAAEVRRLLLTALARPLEIGKLSPRELDLLLRAARRVRLLGWLATRLEQGGCLEELPDAAVEQFESAMAVADARAMMARWELNRIAWALRDHGPLDVIALKGSAYLLHDLPNAGGRLFADVDLLVSARDLPVVETLLKDHGWHGTELSDYDQRFYREWSHEIPAMVHDEREIEVDVHHNIRGRFAPFKPDAQLLLEAAQPIAGSRFRSLSDADLVLHAMTHMMHEGDLADGLRDLVDIDAMLRYFSGRDDAFWDRFAERSTQLNLRLPAFYSLRYARRILGTDVPDRVRAALSVGAPAGPVVALMDRLVPLALFPPHPDTPSMSAGVARWLLYVRSHWVRMPPYMLLRHLAYKAFVRYVQPAIQRLRPRAV